jgi:hypothetical protein
MEKYEVNKSRRSFFLRGTAALGAGLVSATAGAATLFNSSQTVQVQMDQLQQKLNTMEDREALEYLHLTFTALMENKAYDAVVELFTENAAIEMHDIRVEGKALIKKLFVEDYKEEKISHLHTAHRRDQSQKQNLISVNEDRKTASASFYNQVLLCTPIHGHSVLADMARQQGMTAQSYWENGRYDITFSRIRGQWQISRLSYCKV